MVCWSVGQVVRWSASRFNNVLSLDSKLCSSSRSLRHSGCVRPDTKSRSCDLEIPMSSGKHLQQPMMSQCDSFMRVNLCFYDSVSLMRSCFAVSVVYI